MKLPKMYAPTWIKFWSLRNGLGDGLGVIFDIDTQVIRKCMRVACSDGWKWQLCDADKIGEWCYFVDTDIEMLNEFGSGLEFELSSKREYLTQ